VSGWWVCWLWTCIWRRAKIWLLVAGDCPRSACRGWIVSGVVLRVPSWGTFSAGRSGVLRHLDVCWLGKGLKYLSSLAWLMDWNSALDICMLPRIRLF
jgi:hypothetical protein